MIESIAHRLRLLLVVAVATLVLTGGPYVAEAQENSKLTDKAGVIEFEAPGKWREESSDHTLVASGFLGLTRARILIQVYAGTSDADEAGTKWKTTRAARGEVVHTDFQGDARRWITRSKRTTEFVRVVAGTGKSAVAWVELKGPPSGLESDGFAILGTVRWVTKAGAGPGGAPGGSSKKAELKAHKDPGFHIEVSLPAAFEKNRDAKKSTRRFLSLVGAIGEDPVAYVDLYAFPDFDRVEAVAHWWKEFERQGWTDPVRIEGGDLDFRVLVHDRSWNRYVRLLPTEAGVYAIKIDAEADSEGDVIRLLDGLSKGKTLRVIQAHPDPPRAPQGLKPVEHPQYYVFSAAPADEIEGLIKAIDLADSLVDSLLKQKPWEDRKGQVQILADQAAYDAAVRPLGGEKGSAAFWSAEERAVFTHGDALEVDEEQLLQVLAREGIARRFGFRPPFWIDYGVALMVASAVPNNGRATLPYKRYAEGAKNAAGGSVDFESTRWWTMEESLSNAERIATVWGFAFLCLDGTQVGKKWEPSFRAYVKKLRSSADPALASKEFDFSRHTELVDDFKRRMKKL